MNTVLHDNFIQMYKKSKKLLTNTVVSQKTNGKTRPLICYAIVNRKNPQLSALHIYGDRDITVFDDEMLIKVKIERI